MKNRKLLILVCAVLLFFSSIFFAGLSRGMGTPENDPGLKALLEPSPLYPYITGLLVFVLLILITLANIRYTRTEKIKPGSLPWGDLIISIISAIILFVFYPYVYRTFFRIYSDGFLLSYFPRFVLPPLLCYAKVWGGMLLICIWFLLQPITLHIFQRNKAKPKLSARFLLIFLGLFTVWFIFSVFKPLIVLRM